MERLTLSNVNCDHVELHNYGWYVKVCFVVIDLVFVLSKNLADIRD